MRGLAAAARHNKTLQSLPPRQCAYYHRRHHCCVGGVPNSSLASKSCKGNVLHRASPCSIGASSPQTHQRHLPSPLLIFRQTRTKTTTTTTSELCQEELEANIIRLSKSMALGLTSRGYWTNFDHHHHNSNDENNSGISSDDDVVVDVNKNDEDGGVVQQQQQRQQQQLQQQLLPPKVIINMRQQAMALRYIDKRYVQSVSESINMYTGQVDRFVKPGVYACEPDGNDYHTAPDLLHYIATVLRTLPPILNDTILSTTTSATSTTSATTQKLQLRNDAFNAKLAVTSAGGYKYPRHVDNVSPPPPPSDDGGSSSSSNDVGDWDVRKLTIILYLNPDWKMGDGGELRLYLPTPITITTNDHDSNNNDNNNNSIDDDDDESSSSTANYIDLSPVGGRVVLFWSDEISHEVLANAPHIVPSSISIDDDDDDDDSLSSKSQLSFDRYALTIWIPSDHDSLGHSFITPTATNITTY